MLHSFHFVVVFPKSLFIIKNNFALSVMFNPIFLENICVLLTMFVIYEIHCIYYFIIFSSFYYYVMCIMFIFVCLRYNIKCYLMSCVALRKMNIVYLIKNIVYLIKNIVYLIKNIVLLLFKYCYYWFYFELEAVVFVW
jgi:hypothetical protein